MDDPSGSYSATLDRFDRPTAVNDPVNTTDFTWTYRADGQASAFAQPNGNTTALAYDAIGRLTSKDTGSLAQYDWTYNRAGQVLTEASAISGDPSNGVVTYQRRLKSELRSWPHLPAWTWVVIAPLAVIGAALLLLSVISMLVSSLG